MLSRDFFNFKFVDRKDEKKRILSFADFSKKIDYNVLWISGDSEVGKSFLLSNVAREIKKSLEHVVMVKAGSRKLNPNAYLKILIDELDIKTSNDIIEFVKRNYKSILPLATHSTSAIMSVNAGNYVNLIRELENIGNIIFYKEDKKDISYLQMLLEYLENISSEETPVLIILDDFAQADEESLDP